MAIIYPLLRLLTLRWYVRYQKYVRSRQKIREKKSVSIYNPLGSQLKHLEPERSHIYGSFNNAKVIFYPWLAVLPVPAVQTVQLLRFGSQEIIRE